MRRNFVLALMSVSFLATAFLATGCGPDYPNCDDDGNCAEYQQFCVDKLCRECKTDDNCTDKTGDKCMMCSSGYTCVTRSGCCHSDEDCPGGKCWKDAGDDIGTCGGECKTDDHCPAGRKCVGERCVAPASKGCEGGCPAGKKCVGTECVWACDFQAVYFDYNESTLTMDARRLLDQNAQCAQTVGVPVSIEGHTDERGTDEYNMQLGMRRATSAKNFLKDKGVSSGNLSTISYGEDHPVCTESGENCWWRNRRAEFKIK